MRKYGVLVISHGSRDPEWVRLVREAVEGIVLPENAGIRAGGGMPVECAFLELVEGSLIQDGIDRLEGDGVTDMIAVPLFISSGSTHIDEISWALGVKAQPELETDLDRFRLSAAVHWCAPIDDDPEIAELMAAKLRPLSVEPERELVLVIGHGSKEKGFHERWRDGLESLARQVQRIGGFAAGDYAMLLPDQVADKIRMWRERRPELRVLVAPLFLSEGYFTRKVIPERIRGLNCAYSGETLLPSPLVTRWMERRIAAMMDELETKAEKDRLQPG